MTATFRALWGERNASVSGDGDQLRPSINGSCWQERRAQREAAAREEAPTGPGTWPPGEHSELTAERAGSCSRPCLLVHLQVLTHRRRWFREDGARGPKSCVGYFGGRPFSALGEGGQRPRLQDARARAHLCHARRTKTREARAVISSFEGTPRRVKLTA